MSIPIIRSMTVVCTNNTVQDVSIDVWDRGANVRWRQVCGIDRDNAPTTIEVGVKRGREFYTFRAATPAAAARSVRLLGEFVCSGDFVPTARFYAATLGDTLELYVAGEVEAK